MARFQDFKDSAKDPVTNAIVSSTEAYLIITESSTETGDYTVPDLAIPSSPNFPPVNPTRYFDWLPGAPDYTNIDAGNSTFKVVNTASTTVLNRVAYNASLTANTYKIFPETQDSPSAIEFHVGSTSSTAGSGISFQGRFLNFIASSTSFTSPQPETIFGTKFKSGSTSINSSTPYTILTSTEWNTYVHCSVSMVRSTVAVPTYGVNIVQSSTATETCYVHEQGSTAHFSGGGYGIAKNTADVVNLVVAGSTYTLSWVVFYE